MDDGGGQHITGTSLRGYISYAHTDARMVERLMTHLRGHVWSGPRIDFWADTELKAGVDWIENITNAIAHADVFVSCVSPNYLASDFVRTVERPAIAQRQRAAGVLHLSVIMAPCAWYSFTGPFQVIPMHAGRVRPISQWRPHDLGLHTAATQIVQAVHHHFTTSEDREFLMHADELLAQLKHFPFAPAREDEVADTQRSRATTRKQRSVPGNL